MYAKIRIRPKKFSCFLCFRKYIAGTRKSKRMGKESGKSFPRNPGSASVKKLFLALLCVIHCFQLFPDIRSIFFLFLLAGELLPLLNQLFNCRNNPAFNFGNVFIFFLQKQLLGFVQMDNVR